MKPIILFTIFFAFLVSSTSAQVDDRMKHASEIRRAIEKVFLDGNKKVEGVRYDLRLFAGEIVFFDDDGFMLVPRKSKSSDKPISIRYDDVIELEVKGLSLSFFPDPEQKTFGEWSNAKRLRHGDSVDIDMKSKEQLFGVILKISDSDLSIMQGNKIIVLKRDEIARILLARRDTPEAKKILKGAGKGAGAVGRGSGGGGPGAAAVHGAIMIGAAAAGAVTAAAKRFPNDRLLIYAR